MSEHGVRFQPSLAGTLQLSRTNAFFLGGGKALMNAYYRVAERMGIDIQYDAEVERIDDRGWSSCLGGRRLEAARPSEIRARTVVAAAGGFQANLEWLRGVWGAAADNFLIRGTPYDTGRVLRALIDHGAQDRRRCRRSVTRWPSTRARHALTAAS